MKDHLGKLLQNEHTFVIDTLVKKQDIIKIPEAPHTLF